MQFLRLPETLWKLCGNCAFPQKFRNRKLGEISVFYVVNSKKAWSSIQKIYKKSKERGIDTYLNLKLFDSIINTFYMLTNARQIHCKKDIFLSKTENFHKRICKQTLGVSQYVNNMKVSVELGRTSMRTSIGNQMFKRLPVPIDARAVGRLSGRTFAGQFFLVLLKYREIITVKIE